MDTNVNMTPEEMQQALEKAKRELQATLDKMTPEERAQAEMNAQKAIAEDHASMQALLDEAAKAAGGEIAQPRPKFCGNCGAPAGSGMFCSYCGSPLN